MAWLTALLINAVLISFAQTASVLTRAGWIHAGILGTVLWGALGWTGCCLLYTSPSPRD